MNCFDNLEKFNEKIALIYKGEFISYLDFDIMAKKAVFNIKSRSLVFLLCSNVPASVLIYVGCLQKQIVPVLISSEISEDMLNQLVQNYKPNYIFAPKTIKINHLFYNFYETIGDYNCLKNEENIKHTLYSELALLMTTSGSTGSPKLVRQSYKNIQSNTKSIIEYLRITDYDRVITTMPMSYTYGLSIINSHLASGASIILNDNTLMEKEFWLTFKDLKPTTFGGVPYVYEMLKKLRFERMDVSSLRYITQAGGKLSLPLSVEFAEFANKKGFEFVVMYGQTEATARMAYLPFEKAISKAGSMGIAIPGGKFELIDTNENIITENNVVGELVYYGDNVTLGYGEKLSDLSKGDENNGKLITGDMAKRDEDGYYYIVGRKKRFLKMFGNRVNLDEIEQMLKKIGYDCAASGVDDKMKIYIAGKYNEKEIKEQLASTNINVSAFEIIEIDEIPRSESGKIAYSKLPQ